MESSFELFIKERRYLKNVSERTIQWYRESFAWLGKYPLTEAGVKEFVIGMRQGGLKPVSCNCRIRVANASFKWANLPSPATEVAQGGTFIPITCPEEGVS